MFFVLHHAKGSLILEAENREQVVKWSLRQLGDHSGMSTIREVESLNMSKDVERSGTGISFSQAHGCSSLVRLTTDSQESILDSTEGATLLTDELNCCKPILH
jgi:hypothetical protein